MYFATVGAQGKELVFGEVGECELRLNNCGRMVRACWADLPRRFRDIRLDELVVMPNPVHGIIEIVAPVPIARGRDVGAGLALPKSTKGAASSAPTLGDAVRTVKSKSAIAVNVMLARVGKSLWQRNDHEPIVRDGRELEFIRDYIRTNPARWATDAENAAVAGPGGTTDRPWKF